MCSVHDEKRIKITPAMSNGGAVSFYATGIIKFVDLQYMAVSLTDQCHRSVQC